MTCLIEKMNDQYKTIINGLLLKTISKFHSKNLSVLNHFNLISFKFIGFEFAEDEHIEYIIEIEDKVLNRNLNKIFNFFFTKISIFNLKHFLTEKIRILLNKL